MPTSGEEPERYDSVRDNYLVLGRTKARRWLIVVWSIIHADATRYTCGQPALGFGGSGRSSEQDVP